MKHGLSIGAVSKITGIPTDTIRTWERRYDVVTPNREPSGRRSYNEAQVKRLQQIAQLVREGEKVADLADLDEAALQARRAMHTPASRPSNVRVGVLHGTLNEKLGGAVGSGWVQVVQQTDQPGALQGELDVLVVDYQLLGSEPTAHLSALRERTGDPSTLVLHDILPRRLRAALHDSGASTLLTPRPLQEIRAAVYAAADRSPRREAPPAVPDPRYSRAQLEQLMNVLPTMDCECPNHLAVLVIGMRNFEVYSQNCASSSPEDAELHRALAKASGEMRAQLELLLGRVCAFDGIPLVPLADQDS